MLAMKEHHGAEVGYKIAHAKWCNSVESRNNTERGQDLEVFVIFENKREVGTLSTNTKICGCILASEPDKSPKLSTYYRV